MTYSIGEVARGAGCKVQTIRYYEEIGLLPKPARTAGNQRVYGPAHVRRLAFIRHARELGFPIDAIRELAALGEHPDEPCARADAIAAQRLAEVERKIAALTALRWELKGMIARCRKRSEARERRVGDCRVIEVLADHSHGHCLSPAHDGAAASFASPEPLAGSGS